MTVRERERVGWFVAASVRGLGVYLLLLGFVGVVAAGTAEDLQAMRKLYEQQAYPDVLAAARAVAASPQATPVQKAEGEVFVGRALFCLRKWDAAVDQLRRALHDYPELPEPLRSGSYLVEGVCCSNLGRHQDAVSAFRKIITDCPAAGPGVKADAQRRIATVYLDRLGDRKTAVAEFRALLADYPDAPLGYRLQSQRGIARSLLESKDWEAAADEYRTLLADYPLTPDIRGNSCCRLSDCLSSLGQHEQAVEVLRQAAEQCKSATPALQAGIWHRIGTGCLALQNPSEAVEAFVRSAELGIGSDEDRDRLLAGLARTCEPHPGQGSRYEAAAISEHFWRAIAANAGSPAAAERLQMLLTELLLHQNRLDEALFEAKILVDTCSPEQMDRAVSLLTTALKAKDAGLVRVNRFLRYQRTGRAGQDGISGTADDPADPLAGVASPLSDQRNRVFTEALAECPATWQGRLLRSRVCRYSGRPDEALRELKAAFAACPVEKEALQQVTDRIVEVLVQVSGDPEAGSKFVAFQQYGREGPDGQAGTDDDLVDLLASYAR